MNKTFSCPYCASENEEGVLYCEGCKYDISDFLTPWVFGPRKDIKMVKNENEFVVEIQEPEIMNDIPVNDMPLGSVGVIISSPMTSCIGHIVIRSRYGEFWWGLEESAIWGRSENRVRLLPKGTVLKITI